MSGLDLLSLASSIVGIVLGIISIYVAYGLYHKAKKASDRAEGRIRDTQELLERAAHSIRVIEQRLNESARETQAALDTASASLARLETDLVTSAGETRESLQNTAKTLRRVTREIEKQSARLQELVDVHGDLIMSGSADGFLHLLVERASEQGRPVTIGGLREAFRNAGKPRSEFEAALYRARRSMRFNGSLSDDSTEVQP